MLKDILHRQAVWLLIVLNGIEIPDGGGAVVVKASFNRTKWN